MRSFTDSDGREWDVQLNLTTLMRVKSRTGVNLAEAALDPAKLAILLEDPVQMFGCLCALLDDQLTERNITDEMFGQSINSEEIAEAAVLAIWGACSDFSPARGLMDRVTKTTVSEMSRQREKAVKELEEMTDETITESVRKVLSESALNSPELSESTPALTR